MIKVPNFSLEEFSTACLKRAGAIVEPVGYCLLEVLLPEELMQYFNDTNDSHIHLAFDYEIAVENPQSIYVTYGSPFLDGLTSLAQSYGRYAHLYWSGDAPSQQKEVERKINESVEFVQCRKPRLVVQWPAEQIFYAFVFRCTFRSFEKTEDTFTVVMDGFTGCVHPDFEEKFVKTIPQEFPAYKLPAVTIKPVEELYETASQEAGRMADKLSLVIRQSARHLMIRELTRVAAYYEETIHGIEKRMAAIEDDKKERFEKQLQATRAEWERREKDIIQRYGVEAEVRLDHLIAYHLPCLYAKMEVQHKDRFLHQIVVYNPLYGRWEAPVCPKCGRYTRRLLPDKNGLFLCPDHSSRGNQSK